MTPLPPEFQEIVDAVVGLPLSHVWRGYGSMISLEFGQLSSRWRKHGEPADPGGEMSLMIEGSWRVEDDTSILCGTFSDDVEFDRVLLSLVGARVESIQRFGRLPELQVALSGGRYVSSFSTANGDPEWVLFDRRRGNDRWLCVESGRVVLQA